MLYPWRRVWQHTSAFLPGESHGPRSLEGYSSYGCKELDTTEATWHACMHSCFIICVSFCCTRKWIRYIYIYVYIYPYIPPLQPPSHQPPSHTSRSSYSNFTLAICFAHGNVYTCVLLSQFIPPLNSFHPPLAPAPHVRKSILYVCVSIPALQIGLHGLHFKTGKCLPPVHIYALKRPTCGRAWHHFPTLRLLSPSALYPSSPVATWPRGELSIAFCFPGLPQWMLSIP